MAHHEEVGACKLPVKAASTRMTANVSGKSVRAAGVRPEARNARLSKLEAKRLEQFKALMEKYRGKATFAGYDA
jgi:hypothetical protein